MGLNSSRPLSLLEFLTSRSLLWNAFTLSFQVYPLREAARDAQADCPLSELIQLCCPATHSDANLDGISSRIFSLCSPNCATIAYHVPGRRDNGECISICILLQRSWKVLFRNRNGDSGFQTHKNSLGVFAGSVTHGTSYVEPGIYNVFLILSWMLPWGCNCLSG